MRTYIKVSDELRRQIWREFPVCKATVWAALNYITEGGRSGEIRAYALEHGGQVVDEDFEPNCLTEHSQDEMRQSFGGGVCVWRRSPGSWRTRTGARSPCAAGRR